MRFSTVSLSEGWHSIQPIRGDDRDPALSADVGDSLQFVTRDDRAGGVGGAGDDDAIRCRFQRGQGRGGELEPFRFAAGQFDRLDVHGLQRVAIGDIAGPGDGDRVSGGESHGQRQHQPGRGAAGENDLVRRDADAVPFGIEPGDPRLQRRVFPVAARFGIQPAVRLGNGGGRRAGAGLAELHVDHPPPLRLQTVGQGADGNGVEGIDLGCHPRRLAGRGPKGKARPPRWEAAPLFLAPVLQGVSPGWR